jgi:hypothetical protein
MAILLFTAIASDGKLEIKVEEEGHHLATQARDDNRTILLGISIPEMLNMVLFYRNNLDKNQQLHWLLILT